VRRPSVSARCIWGLNRLRGAREQFQSVLSVFPVLSRQGLGEVALRVLLRLGRQDEAIAMLTKSRTAKPDDEDIVVGLAILLAQKERFREAVTLLDDANRQYPDRVATATTLARLLASSPDRSQTRRQACTRSRHTRVRDGSDAGARRTLALALAELERCDEALTWMKRAVAAAGQAGDAEETARLTIEMRKYESVSCRP
jgi:tetratricopeptide (TPR) repeat protein